MSAHEARRSAVDDGDGGVASKIALFRVRFFWLLLVAPSWGALSYVCVCVSVPCVRR